MKNRILIVFIMVLVIHMPVLKADEGMWIPLLIEKLNIDLMQEKGFKLTAEDIYSVNEACMKDAVVLFGGGCTGEVISPDGLLITNHHCGYSYIQRHTTLENNYLTDGFWAMSRDEELPNPGLTVIFLKRMEDVTKKVMKGVKKNMDDIEREEKISSNISEITKKAVSGTGYTANVKPFFMGNQYFLFVNEVFRDIRLVGAPPSAIGKFGGDTDNWMWPRHTGDFSLFRIYAGRDNKPANYSEENVPYKPLYHFPVSLKGVDEGDFTMVFGYPGSTSEYVPSYHINMIKNHFNPEMINIRTRKLEIIESAINSDPLIRIQYSTKNAGISNSWKRWIGENQGLEKMGTIEKKRHFEAELTSWINADKKRKALYGDILDEYESLYSVLTDYYLVNSFTNEVFFNYGVEAVGFALNMKALADLISDKSTEDHIMVLKKNLKERAEQFFRNYDMSTDKELFVALMSMYGKTLEEKWLAPEYLVIRDLCDGDFRLVVDEMYNKTVFADKERCISFIEAFDETDMKELNNDPFYLLSLDVLNFLNNKVRPELRRINREIGILNKSYMTAQTEFDEERIFYPDANSSLRLSFGTVKGYYAKDAVRYRYYSTLEGIIEKDNPDIYDYDVPDRLKELYSEKDYGRYVHDGEVPVCFIADNHTTGGNSGSPVINSLGHLVGVNFDRAWEGVASDLAFNPRQSRNISLDIRYALFIIDKYAGAGYLLDEMTIIE